MGSDTIEFIYALKKPQTDTARSLRQLAIDYFSEKYFCDKSVYTESVLFDMIFTYLLDYIDTCDKPSSILRDISYRRTLNSYVVTSAETEVDWMLSALYLTRVRDNQGRYVNGFTSLENLEEM